MQPQAPQQQPDNDQYQFIMAAGAPKKRPLVGNSKTTRIVVFIVGLVLLALAALIFFSILSNKSKQPTEELVSIVEMQSKIINLSDVGVKKARTTEALNLAITTKLSLETDQQSLGAYVATQERGFKTSTYAALRNTSLEATLTRAEQANNFDDTFVQLLNAELVKYQSALKKSYDSAVTPKAKAVLSADYNHASALLPKK